MAQGALTHRLLRKTGRRPDSGTRPAHLGPSRHAAALFLLLSCGLCAACDDGAGAAADAGGGSDGGLAGATDQDAARPTLASSLESAGYTLQNGAAVAFRLSDCASLPSCFASNASSPYVLFALPAAPGGAALTDSTALGALDTLPEGAAPAWLLGPGEAVLVTGRTPPPARYFGFAPYLYDRLGDDGTRRTVFASLADATNVANLHTGAGGPFGAQFALILTADARADAAVRAALGAVGYGESVINTLPLPADVLRMGTDASADSVMLLGRVALFEDPVEGGHWLDAPPLAVWRISPTDAAPPTPIAVPPRGTPGTGTDESALAPALDALEAAIRAAHVDEQVEAVPITPASALGMLLRPEVCIDRQQNCLGEVSDTVYSAGPLAVAQGQDTLPLSDDPEDAFWVLGVNHEATGKATYSNAVVTWAERQAGVLAVESPEMPGSAAVFLPDHEDADALFAFRIARACDAGDPFCRRLPEDFPGVPLDGSLLFVFRAYLEPGTSLAPSAREILTERVLHVSARR